MTLWPEAGVAFAVHPASGPDTYCSFAECDEATGARELYCDAHTKQLQRGQPLRPIQRRADSPWERLTESALAYADASEDADYDRAEARMKAAAIAWALTQPRVQRLMRTESGQLRPSFAMKAARHRVRNEVVDARQLPLFRAG